MLINIVPEGFFMDTAARIALLFGLPVPDSLWSLPAPNYKKPQESKLNGHRFKNNAPLQPLLEAANPLYCILAKK